MSKTFVTSDTHFGHENIIRYCGRPFKSASHMNGELVRRWNERVSREDIVYFLGDFAMGKGVDSEFIMQKLAELNGKKYIVLGNHDQSHKKFRPTGLTGIISVMNANGYWKEGQPDTPEWIKVPEDEFGITELADIFELTFEGTKFVMCHYPMNDWNGKFHGTVHLHGHQHAGYSASKAREMARNKRYDVGVDMYGGPVQLTGDLRYLKDPQGWTE